MMSRSNNKGISLIDVIVAVAVLSILISPIIAQVFTTVDTSSRAKERQYVVDDADLVMEYFRSKSMKELSEEGDKGDAVTILNAYDPKDISVTAWDVDYTSATGINYTAFDFDLAGDDDPSSIYQILGRLDTGYSRTVTVDDLNNVLLSKKKEINYKINELPETKKNKLLNEGFTITNEGSAVKYDDDGHIVEVVVNDIAEAVKNPNSATPIITDIDSQKMAIIEGNASTIDNQFEDDIISSMLAYVNSHKSALSLLDSTSSPIPDIDNFEGETLYDYLRNKKNLNEQLDTLRTDPDSIFRRSIKLSVTAEDVVGEKPGYYNVKCDVYYYAKYTSNKLGDMDNTFHYTVFDQDFHTAEPPDVFFVYEPLVMNTSGAGGFITYSPYEYINVKSDKYTSGAVEGFDPSKVYLVKAESNWAEKVVNKRTADEIEDARDNDEYYYYFLTDFGGGRRPVKIFVNQVTSTTDSDALPLQIITNISWRPNHATTDMGGDNPVVNHVYSSGTNNWQFYPAVANSAYVGTIPDIDLSSDEDIAAYPINGYAHSNIGTIQYDTGLEERYAIDCPANDTVEYGRQYTITIRYNNAKEDSQGYRLLDDKRKLSHPEWSAEENAKQNKAYMYFIGAKGAD